MQENVSAKFLQLILPVITTINFRDYNSIRVIDSAPIHKKANFHYNRRFFVAGWEGQTLKPV